jgi:spermidine synthase
MAGDRGANRFAFYLGVFLVTAATLLLQIVETRILSVVSWYAVAFLVVGLAMFGITAGAVRVYTWKGDLGGGNLYRELAHQSHAFGIFTAASLVLQMGIPILGWRVPGANVLAWFVVGAVIALPFYFSGIVIALALTRSRFPVGRVYAVDLAGAALGCLATLALLNLVDAPSAILWAGALASAGGLAFARAAGTMPEDPGQPRRQSRSGLLVCVLLVAFASFNSLSGGVIRPLFVKGKIELDAGKPMFSEWNSFSRISVMPETIGPAHMWGAAPTFVGEDWIIPQRLHQIDALAATAAYRLRGDFAKAGFLEYDITALAYVLPGIERAAVIGVGAGRDVITARYFGVSQVIGVEINPILVRLLVEEPGFADYTGVRHDPGIELVVDEARSWFARSRRTFDLIQMSLIDTFAATGAGAFTLTENGLYTVEAWRIFLDRLSPDGVLTISRQFWPENIFETGRMVSLAMAAGFAMGFEDPRQHIFLAASDTLANLILSRSPLAGDRLEALQAAARRLEHRVFIAPDAESESPVLRRIAASRSLAELSEAIRGQPLDLSPPVDDRPFFFNQLPLTTALAMIFGAIDTSLIADEGGVIHGNLEATSRSSASASC